MEVRRPVALIVFTVQAEALAPSDLADEVRTAIQAHVDLDQLEEDRAVGAREQIELLDVLDGLDRSPRRPRSPTFILRYCFAECVDRRYFERHPGERAYRRPPIPARMLLASGRTGPLLVVG